MISVKSASPNHADSCSACWENKATVYIDMGRKDPRNDRFIGGSTGIRLCSDCITEMNVKLIKERLGEDDC